MCLKGNTTTFCRTKTSRQWTEVLPKLVWVGSFNLKFTCVTTVESRTLDKNQALPSQRLGSAAGLQSGIHKSQDRCTDIYLVLSASQKELFSTRYFKTHTFS